MARIFRRLGRAVRRRRPSRPDPEVLTADLLAGRRVERILDVGAHVGVTVRRWRELFPRARILAVEPDARARQNLEVVAREVGDVVVIPAALSAAPGEATFHAREITDVGSLRPFDAAAPAVMKAEHLRAAESFLVRVETVDALLSAHGWDELDLLKIDVQGCTLDVLEGSRGLLHRQGVGAILCEVEFVPVYAGQALADAVIAFLRDRGYVFHSFPSLTESASRRLLWADALFVRPDLLPATAPLYRAGPRPKR